MLVKFEVVFRVLLLRSTFKFLFKFILVFKFVFVLVLETFISENWKVVEFNKDVFNESELLVVVVNKFSGILGSPVLTYLLILFTTFKIIVLLKLLKFLGQNSDYLNKNY